MSRPDNAVLKRGLHQRFPATRFRVSSGRGTGRSWSHVYWTDGPSTQLVDTALVQLGAAPGHMDNTDYFNGERISTTRTLSDGFKRLVADALLAPKPVPPVEAWEYQVRGANNQGWYSLGDCIYRAASRRDYFEHERFNAHAWLEAWAHNLREAPASVSYTSPTPLPLERGPLALVRP